MRRAIVIGELEPGAHLKEPALAEMFGVSRLPVREAIAQLAREGLVRVEPRRGAYVVGVTEQDIHDIYECRVVLETYAVERTAPRIDEQGVAALGALIAQMEAAMATGKVQAVAAADMAFHRLIISLSGNRALAQAWEPLAPLIETALSISEEVVPDLPLAVSGHHGIVAALARHDGPAAADVLRRDHLPGGEKLVHEAIRNAREGRGNSQPA
jgi:DNA-binding GntR family transcriptional regulator